ncbi:MAG: HAMP domain-containing histidine kinase [Lachnospiraceae bacterium]|jgi:signal transduction histidine kinase|nr:HAMP domain-containing histidine kinase [Lachnospiraceae bacterium]MCI9358877.1 HAMP domain-containing histidine kinase [Lachnospiraceae bacterium]
MNQTLILLFLLLCLGVLFCLVLYQQFADRTGTRARLREISEKLERIIDTDSDERIMVFTENRELMELAAQMNCLLENHQKMKADSRRAQAASKKMLANISHDLKTPMTVILGYLEIMQLDGAVTDEMLKKIQQKAQNVMELMNHFFTLAKLESGDLELELSQVDAAEICREGILDFYEILIGSGFQVEIDLPETAVYVWGDREAIQRILSNLISNAVRYGKDGKYLKVALRSDGKYVYLDVADKGKGIEKSFADSVFDRLFTMEDSRSRDIQGNGLGLTIAKNLAVQQGGDLTLESTPWVKTVFTVRLQEIKQIKG